MRQYPRIKQRWEQLKPHPLTWDKNFIYCCFLTPTLQQNTLWIFPIVWKQRLFFFFCFWAEFANWKLKWFFFPWKCFSLDDYPWTSWLLGDFIDLHLFMFIVFYLFIYFYYCNFLCACLSNWTHRLIILAAPPKESWSYVREATPGL